MKRKHEEVSKESFTSWLNTKSISKSIRWQEVKQEDEPPDWYLTIGDVRYAIEATSIVDYVAEFDPPLSIATISISLSNFVDRVEKYAKSKGPLNGVYIFSLSPIPNFRKQKQRIFKEAISYIDRTRNLESANKFFLGDVGYHSLSIGKIKSDRDFVDKIISLGAKFEGQAQNELQSLLCVTLERKAKLLREIGEPIILLILDAFAFTNLTDWGETISKISIPSELFSVFQTFSGKQAHLLFTRNSWWI